MIEQQLRTVGGRRLRLFRYDAHHGVTATLPATVRPSLGVSGQRRGPGAEVCWRRGAQAQQCGSASSSRAVEHDEAEGRARPGAPEIRSIKCLLVLLSIVALGVVLPCMAGIIASGFRG